MFVLVFFFNAMRIHNVGELTSHKTEVTSRMAAIFKNLDYELLLLSVHWSSVYRRAMGFLWTPQDRQPGAWAQEEAWWHLGVLLKPWLGFVYPP